MSKPTFMCLHRQWPEFRLSLLPYICVCVRVSSWSRNPLNTQLNLCFQYSRKKPFERYKRNYQILLATKMFKPFMVSVAREMTFLYKYLTYFFKYISRFCYCCWWAHLCSLRLSRDMIGTTIITQNMEMVIAEAATEITATKGNIIHRVIHLGTNSRAKCQIERTSKLHHNIPIEIHTIKQLKF